MGLRGEYIWDGSYLLGADTNLDDMGHEGYILQSISNEYGEDLLSELEDIIDNLNKIPDEQLESNPLFRKLDDAGIEINEVQSIMGRLKKDIRMESYDPDNVKDAFNVLKTIYPEKYTDQRINDAINSLNGKLDPRVFGMKYYDYVLIRNNNFDVWGWNQDRAKSIMDAISEIIGEELENPQSELWDETIIIDDFSNPKSKPYDMTIRELDENPFTISKAPVVTSKDERTPYLDPRARGSSQAWNQRYTSEGFIGYIKRRDYNLFKELTSR